MGEVKFSFFLLDFILLIVALGMINIVFDLHRYFFILHLLFIVGLGFLAVIGMAAAYNELRWGFIILAAVFGLVIIDLLFVYYMTVRPAYFLTILVLSAFGLLISAVKIKKEEDEFGEDFDEDIPEESVKTEFKPGKFVASKTAKSYHAPKCDWAKRIKKSNQVWFDNKKEAEDKGYKSHDCIQEKIYKNY